MATRKGKDDFLCGALVALGCVYDADEETLAQEIISTVGASALLRVAQKEEDCYLPNLKKTIRFLNWRRSA